jgi:hypothetical protein
VRACVHVGQPIRIVFDAFALDTTDEAADMRVDASQSGI